MYKAKQVAKIIGAKSVNIVSVWANRGLLIPSEVIQVSAKKKTFMFSYGDLFAAHVMMQLGNCFLVQYEFGKNLMVILKQAVKMKTGYICITDKGVSNATITTALPSISGHDMYMILNIGEIHKGLKIKIKKEK